MDAKHFQAYLAASNLILDHKLAARLKARDVLHHLLQFNAVTANEAHYVATGPTEKIQTDRLLAKMKAKGAPGYWALRSAMEMCGAKYTDLINEIDVAMPPQSPGFQHAW
ncbi:uncharacterized protein LOC144434452 [Glandiceps talaboti]